MSYILHEELALSEKFLDGKQGRGRYAAISGVIMENNIPVSRRVFCYLRRSGALIGITRSDENGNYQFTDLSLKANYYIVSLDENGDAQQYNAVVQDLITPNEVLS